MALFHIAQEALSNAVKNGRASRVDVRLVVEDEAVVLVVSDNGRGFSEAEMQPHMGHGLINMRDRAHSVGGSLSLQSVETGGAEVRVNVPAPGEGHQERS